MANKTFVRITNRDIYEKLEAIEHKVDKTNGMVKGNRTWLFLLSGAFGTSFLFVISWLLQIK